MEPHPTSQHTAATSPRSRVWRDVVAESLLCIAVGIIAVTGNDSVVLQLNLWLASLVPAYDPMVTMLVLVVLVIAVLTLGAIGLKLTARRASEATALKPARQPRARQRRTLPYLGL